MKMRGLLSTGVTLSVLSLVACSRGPDSYMPLVQGMTWKYQVTTQLGPDHELNAIMTVTNLAAKDVQGKVVIPIKEEFDIRGNTHSSISYVAEDSEGIYLFGQPTSDEVNPQPLHGSGPLYFLKKPLQAGRIWDTPIFLPPARLTLAKAILESINESVAVPAGTFKNCLKVRISTIRGNRDRWYAPLVGLVKSVYSRDGQPETTELISFKP